MRLSTFSFKPLPRAALLAVALILIIEAALSGVLERSFFNHETDEILYKLKTNSYNSRVVFIGDSNAKRIMRGLEWDPAEFLSIPATRGVEMTGQHYFLKRYLERNSNPEAVVLYSANPLGMNLDSIVVENYIQRCFLRWAEIFEILKLKRDLAFSLRMVTYRLLPTYRYRLHLQKYFTGASNADILFGTAPGPPASSKGDSLAELLEKPHGGMLGSISRIYFEKLLSLLAERNIHFYYILAPLPEVTYSEERGKYRRLFNYLNQLEEENSYFHVVRDYKYLYPLDHFMDRKTHLTIKMNKRVQPKLLRTLRSLNLIL